MINLLSDAGRNGAVIVYNCSVDSGEGYSCGDGNNGCGSSSSGGGDSDSSGSNIVSSSNKDSNNENNNELNRGITLNTTQGDI